MKVVGCWEFRPGGGAIKGWHGAMFRQSRHVWRGAGLARKLYLRDTVRAIRVFHRVWMKLWISFSTGCGFRSMVFHMFFHRAVDNELTQREGWAGVLVCHRLTQI